MKLLTYTPAPKPPLKPTYGPSKIEQMLPIIRFVENCRLYYLGR